MLRCACSFSEGKVINTFQDGVLVAQLPHLLVERAHPPVVYFLVQQHGYEYNDCYRILWIGVGTDEKDQRKSCECLGSLCGSIILLLNYSRLCLNA